ncbi:M20/M25/M40 family metallo-hydrolase [Microbacterium sp.]|uniref:M20/M25/M40 family metallo-hydrolase n=1 Tax=Microbacterium sp. TaxID=51671 RepID=UPI0028115DFB|nr:M20/M25/M40 family metallo-hydrolase [Microbacterium sp.]
MHIETPSYDAAASVRISDLLAEHFAAAGASVERTRTDAGIHLVADIAGAGDPWLLVGHTDTVWPTGSLTGAVPWSVSGDVVRGPGAFDMKAGIVVMLLALTRIRPLPVAERRAVRVVLVCDEEVGSPESTPLLRESALGAAAVLGFESPHPDGAFKVGRRGSTRVRLSVTGRAAHAALDPENGISAVDELVDQLIRVRAITASDALPGPVLCNTGTVSGGSRTNVVAARAEAELGLRFTDPQTERIVLADLAGLTPLRDGAVVHAEVLSSRPAWLASAGDEALLRSISAAASDLGQHIEGRPAAGAGDTNLLGSLGIPTVDGFGPQGAGAHSTDEHFLLSSLMKRVELLSALLRLGES